MLIAAIEGVDLEEENGDWSDGRPPARNAGAHSV